MNAREKALAESSARYRLDSKETLRQTPVQLFGRRVFTRAMMQVMLPENVYLNLVHAQEGKGQIRPEYADVIALAMKEWAASHGATHYCHWFQPLTGATAEKHDSFIEWKSTDEVIERFDGKQLIRGEPDASSFPSGGLRSTYEARGYTGWDPTSPVFIWKGGDGITLCIPTVFFSWTGDVLDNKIPLLRSDEKINRAVLRLLRHVGVDAERVFSTVGWEQEYFVVDRALRALRPDLVMLGRTVFGARPAKGQQLEDHYFGAIKDRVLSFMQDFENSALELGIPVKTRHNEVAPAQHEVAPVYERASVAVDHNILLMELMRQVATNHDLACLLHEKPFAGINGSGKHVNWSLATDGGLNLLNPSDSPRDSLLFLILLTAIVSGVHRHADVLRASIGSRSNDFRLGGHEAPPAILSVYLGEALERILDHLEEKGAQADEVGAVPYRLGIPAMIELPKDNTDRNRTSPFAFTGTKFEFRSVGSSANCALPVAVLNLVVSESLNEIIEAIEARLEGRGHEAFKGAAIPVLQQYLQSSKAIRFSGNNYSAEWQAEAARRNLPNEKNSCHAARVFLEEKVVKLFDGVLTRAELASRYEVMVENYCLQVELEANIMLDLFRTEVLPAAMRHQSQVAKSIKHVADLGVNPCNEIRGLLGQFAQNVEEAIQRARRVEELVGRSEGAERKLRCEICPGELSDSCEALRQVVDWLEDHVADDLWRLPKYREILHTR